VFEKIIEVLEIVIQKDENDEEARIIDFTSYLKLRYFFIDKKAN
jgi:hypothetical protein